MGDAGHKIGLDGVDNGWIIFQNYRIPRASLLDKYAQVDADGSYHSSIKSKTKRFGVQISSLSTARVAVMQISLDLSLV